jgi:hypothetical protein
LSLVARAALALPLAWRPRRLPAQRGWAQAGAHLFLACSSFMSRRLASGCISVLVAELAYWRAGGCHLCARRGGQGGGG